MMKLNEKQINEALLILQEECAEVVQAASKVFRFGTESRWPTEESASTLECLTMEIGQVLAMIDILVESGYISDTNMNAARYHKKEKLKTWSSIYAN